jgi:hypothetical protein
MPVTATSREAKISEALVNMTASCAAVLAEFSLTYPGTKARIVEDYAGERGTFKAVDGSTLNPDATFIIVRLGPVISSKRARDTYGWEGTAKILFNQLATGSDTPAEKFRRTRNVMGDIRAQLEAQLGSQSPFQALAAAEFSAGEIYLSDEIAANRLHLVADIDCKLFDLP